MKIRNTVRLVLLDPDQRLLLVKAHTPDVLDPAGSK